MERRRIRELDRGFERRTIRPLAPVDPGDEQPQPPVVAPARQSVGVAWPILRALLLCLAVLLLLNTKAFVAVVEHRPAGPSRTALLAVARTLDRGASRVGLDRPAAWLDYAQVDRGDVPRFSVPGGVSSVPLPSPTLPPATATPVPEATPTPAPEVPTAVAAAVTPDVPPTATSPPAPTATPTPPPHRAITADSPLRVYVGGDSFVDSMAEVLAETGDKNGLLTVVADGHASSGLSWPDFFDWAARLQAALSVNPPPEAVVFMVGANDGVELQGQNGGAEYGSPEWNAEYERRVGVIMDIVGQHGARLYYVGQPVMRDSKQSRIANDINVAVAREAAKRPWVTYIDSWSLTVDKDGNYSTFLVDDNGETVKARADDGIHLTPASTIWIAHAIYRAIEKDWELPK